MRVQRRSRVRRATRTHRFCGSAAQIPQTGRSRHVKPPDSKPDVRCALDRCLTSGLSGQSRRSVQLALPAHTGLSVPRSDAASAARIADLRRKRELWGLTNSHFADFAAMRCHAATWQLLVEGYCSPLNGFWFKTPLLALG